MISQTNRFPGNKSFAFTLLDDTDDSTLENVKPIYRLLRDLGMRTTKTAWPMACPEGSRLYFAAETLQDAHYLEFVKELVDSGFELASHGATMESSSRGRTERGLAFIKKEFDTDFRLHCNHGRNIDNIYWGLGRYQSPPIRLTVNILQRFIKAQQYAGHLNGSHYFWGDLCRERFKYVRNFTFNKLDISNIPPGHPYRIRSTPYVNFWFSTADAPDVNSFNQLVNKESVDEMISNGGYTIISTHLGKGFVRDGKVDQQVKDIMTYISKQNGWFVPASNLLDFLLQGVERTEITALDQFYLELLHIKGRLLDKTRNKLRGVR